ncbi:RecB family exonuclease [Patescibacteria group bacterium]
MRTSYSALATYKLCPQKYKFQEIDKIKAPKSKEAIFGTIVHSALKHMFSKDPLFPTLDEVLSHFRESLAESKINEKEKEIYKEAGATLLKKFWMKNPPWNFSVIGLEQFFEVVLEDPKTKKTHVFVGKIDRIDKNDDESYEVIDYKTARRLPSQNEVDQDLQLSLYHMGLLKRWPHLNPENIKLSLYFLKAGEKLSSARNKESLKNTEKDLFNVIRTIEEKEETKDFPPTPSALCSWCGYKEICPAWKHLYERKKQQAPEKIKVDSMVDRYNELKKEISDREAEIKKLAVEIHNYLDESGLERLFGDTVVLARKIQERNSVDMEKLKEVLEPVGLWKEVLSPDQKRLKKLLPTLSEDLQEKIKQAIIIKKFPYLHITVRS